MEKVKEFLRGLWFDAAGTIIAVVATTVILVLLLIAASASMSLNGFAVWFVIIPTTAVLAVAAFGGEHLGVLTVAIVALIAELVWVILPGSAIISVKPYQNMVAITETSFETVEIFDTKNVQLVDKDSAVQLGDRVFGKLGQDLVSQYTVGDYDQIVYRGALYRVAPIEFRGVASYFSNKKTPGYILVNCENGESQVIEVEGGIAYSQNAWFAHNVVRNNWLANITAIYGSPVFEIDEKGHPYWVTPIGKYDFVGKHKDIVAVRILDAVTGEASVYGVNEVPEWVDNVYSTGTAYYRFNKQKQYANGFWNFSHKGVVAYTEDYAYLQLNGHLYFYTGVTSVGGDESNVGFAYVNLRTNEVTYVAEAGAEEFSARASAEGSVQEKGYTAAFPTMVNVGGEPAYFMAMKDQAGLIKAYAFVSYRDYQKVGVGSSVEDALKAYQKGSVVVNMDDTKEVSFEVSEVKVVTINGNSVVLFLDVDGNIHSYSVEEDGYNAVFAKTGDILAVEEAGDGKILKIH